MSQRLYGGPGVWVGPSEATSALSAARFCQLFWRTACGAPPPCLSQGVNVQEGPYFLENVLEEMGVDLLETWREMVRRQQSARSSLGSEGVCPLVTLWFSLGGQLRAVVESVGSDCAPVERREGRVVNSRVQWRDTLYFVPVKF